MKQNYFSKTIFFLLLSIIIGLSINYTSIQDVKLVDENSEIELGKALFFDTILSSDYSLSCASCHKPDFAFADTLAFSIGVEGRLGKRNAPSVMNMAFRDSLFWDGRASTLEAQVVFPIEDANEMNLPFSEAVRRIQNDKRYQRIFKLVYGVLPDSSTIVRAIAAYERSLETSDTPNDRWLNEEEPSGMSAQMIRGRELFTSNKTKCFDCHFTPDFTNDEYKNIGLFDGKALNDSGRYLVTKRVEDIGKFKVPGLRNVAITGPYMHNGMFKTLREVIDYYDDPSKFVHAAINTDTIMPKKMGLSEGEKEDLIAFLHSLTDDRFLKKQ